MALLSRVPMRSKDLIFGTLRILENICGVRVPNMIKTLTVMFYHIEESFDENDTDGQIITHDKINRIVTLNKSFSTHTKSMHGSMMVKPNNNLCTTYNWVFRIISRPDSVRASLRAFEIGVQGSVMASIAVRTWKYDRPLSKDDVIIMKLCFDGNKRKDGILSFAINGRKPEMEFTDLGRDRVYQMMVDITSGYGGDYPSIQLMDYFEH